MVKLEENRDALSPSEYASRADRIARAYKSMASDIAKAFFNATAAANGFDVTLGEMSSRQLQTMTAATTPDGIASAGASEREAYIREGLIKRGMPAHVADGFIANFKDESGLRPGAVEGAPNVHGTRGYGLYQLTDTKAGVGRRSQFERFATDSGRKFDDTDAQMDFLIHELQTSERSAGEAILRSGSASEAAQLIVSKFLRPAKKHENARIAKYGKLDATPATSGAASVSSLSVWNPDAPNSGFASESDMKKAFSNAQGISTVLSGYGEKARDAVTAAVLKIPGLVNDTSLLLSLQEKRIEGAAAIIAQTDQSLADAFRENSSGTAAEETTRKAVDKAKDLADAAKKANEEIVDNVTKNLINDIRDEREKSVQS